VPVSLRATYSTAGKLPKGSSSHDGAFPDRSLTAAAYCRMRRRMDEAWIPLLATSRPVARSKPTRTASLTILAKRRFSVDS
jgi:hypothetical protein